MKINLNDIRTEKCFLVTGDELWLKEIYSCFPTAKGKESPKIQSNIKLLRIDNDYFRLQGTLSYTPFLTCDRCGESISFQIEQNDINVIFQPLENSLNMAKSVDLSKKDFDNYYYNDDDTLDLEAFLNEYIQLAIPTHILPDLVQGKTTHQCEASQVIHFESTQQEQQQENPFAALRNLFAQSKEEK